MTGTSTSGGQSDQTGWHVGVRERPALGPAEAEALPAGTVAVFSAGKKTLCADSRTALGGDLVGHFLATLPPPPLPTPPPPPSAAAISIASSTASRARSAAPRR